MFNDHLLITRCLSHHLLFLVSHLFRVESQIIPVRMQPPSRLVPALVQSSQPARKARGLSGPMVSRDVPAQGFRDPQFSDPLKIFGSKVVAI